MGKNIRSSSRPKALAPSIPMPPLADAMDAVHLSVDRFCLLAGVEALAEMMEEDATTVCGARHRRHGDRRGYRWGRTHSEIGYHGGKVKVARPRVRDRAGKEVKRVGRRYALPSGRSTCGAERVDPPYHRAPSARGRPGESAWRRHLEVGRFPAMWRCHPWSPGLSESTGSSRSTSRRHWKTPRPARPTLPLFIVWRFHGVLTWFGCTLCLAAISWIVLSPRSASSATLALKSAVNRPVV